jgi:hypothetical protein
MSTRTTTKTITFRRPVALSGFDGPCPAGTYDVVTDEETIDDLTFLAWRRVATVIHVRNGGAVQAIRVDPIELDALLLADNDSRLSPESLQSRSTAPHVHGRL